MSANAEHRVITIRPLTSCCSHLIVAKRSSQEARSQAGDWKTRRALITAKRDAYFVWQAEGRASTIILDVSRVVDQASPELELIPRVKGRPQPALRGLTEGNSQSR